MKQINKLLTLFALIGLLIAPVSVFASALNFNPNLRTINAVPDQPAANLNVNTNINIPAPVELDLSAPEEEDGINPQLPPSENQVIDPDPPQANKIIEPDPPSKIFSLIKKCVIDYKNGAAQIDDEVTWNKCQEKYLSEGAAKVVPAIIKCFGANKIDDEVTWSKCQDNINSLSPQPDPPGLQGNAIGNAIGNALAKVSLNPQPELPLPGVNVTELLNWVGNLAPGQAQQVMSGKLQGFDIKGEKSGNGNLLKFEESSDQSATGTTLGLDAENIKFLLVGNKITIATSTLDFSSVVNKTPVVEVKLRNASSSAPTLVKVKMLNNNALLNFDKGNGEGTVTVKSDFTVQDGKIVLAGPSGDISLAQNPDGFYRGIEKGLKNKNQGIEIQDVSLRVEDGKPIYDVKVKEPVKLFGFIPWTINSEVTANGADNSIAKVKRPWYSFLVTKANIPELKLAADFAVTEVKLVPDTYKQGDSIVAYVTITNVGTALGVSHYDIGNGSCTTIAYFWGQSQIQWYCSLIALNVGESITYDFNLSNAECEQFRFVYDANKSLKDDPDYSNNTGTVLGNCSQ